MQANEALRAEIERLRGEPSPLVAARAAKEETLADRDKFLKLLDNLQVCAGCMGCMSVGVVLRCVALCCGWFAAGRLVVGLRGCSSVVMCV